MLIKLNAVPENDSTSQKLPGVPEVPAREVLEIFRRFKVRVLQKPAGGPPTDRGDTRSTNAACAGRPQSVPVWRQGSHSSLPASSLRPTRKSIVLLFQSERDANMKMPISEEPRIPIRLPNINVDMLVHDSHIATASINL